MAKQIQLRRGTTTEHDTFTGAVGELTYDTEKKQLRVHDGSTVGGKVVDDTTRDVTSQVSNATETVEGKAKIATTAIAQAGTNDTDFLTTKKLRDALNATGNAPISACRASGRFRITTPAVLSSFNIASIVRVSAGIYLVTMSQAMPNANYIALLSGSSATLNGQSWIAKEDLTFTKTTTQFRIICSSMSNGDLIEIANSEIIFGVFS